MVGLDRLGIDGGIEQSQDNLQDRASVEDAARLPPIVTTKLLKVRMKESAGASHKVVIALEVEPHDRDQGHDHPVDRVIEVTSNIRHSEHQTRVAQNPTDLNTINLAHVKVVVVV